MPAYACSARLCPALKPNSAPTCVQAEVHCLCRKANLHRKPDHTPNLRFRRKPNLRYTPWLDT